MLLDAAIDQGAELASRVGRRHRCSTTTAWSPASRVEVGDKNASTTVRIEAQITLDCSGQATFLANRERHRTEVRRLLRQADRLLLPRQELRP